MRVLKLPWYNAHILIDPNVVELPDTFLLYVTTGSLSGQLGHVRSDTTSTCKTRYPTPDQLPTVVKQTKTLLVR